ncbi:S8 family serine peptidase [Rufibacter sp. LB8]|uniref:S8 family serine peptidase n=1 Tax=Rufibacter sp. LB8 TaxID=2777781 RepID=UPI00178C6E44|nr:S8 family serine peptidase [Rufibacter sp. LB8]
MGQNITSKMCRGFLGAIGLVFLSLVAVGQHISPGKTENKRAPVLRPSAAFESPAQIRIQVKNRQAFLVWANAALPDLRLLPSPDSLVFAAQRPNSKHLQLLEECPWVTFLDVGPRKANEEAYLQNADFRVNRIEALQTKYPALGGAGLVVSVKEQPFDSTDIDFKKRVLPAPAFGSGPQPHATSMATLIAGGGNSAPSSKGAAWQSTVTAANFDNLLPDNTALLKTQQVSVQNHSYGVGIENYYGLESQAYDRQALDIPALLHVFSSGNAGHQTPVTGPYAGITGFANLTGQFKVSKNTLSVGAIDTSGQVSLLSSRGPAYDGRIKPELVAFGEAGTSEAAAVVSGIALVVQEVYQKENKGALPSSALVKAALINAADDKGRSEVDYAAGFGNADALGAVEAILQKRYAEGAVTQGATQKIRFTVPAGAARVKVTLVWQDPEGNPTAPKALVNDLDLTLISLGSGEVWLPWGLSTFAHKDSLLAPARRKRDHLNNVEQVTLANPTAGDYEIQVMGYAVTGSQSFSVVYEVEPAFSWVYPALGSTVEAGQKTRVRWEFPVKTGARGRLEFKWNSPGATWQLLKDNIDLANEAADITLPDTTAVAVLRLVIASETYETGAFVLSPALALKVGYQCGDAFMLFWSKAPGAEAYQVYTLGNRYLEPLVQTADTLMVLQKSQNPSVHYAVAPVVKGQLGQRSLTLQYTQQGVGCYIVQFLPKQFVTDTVLLDLQLSTTAGLLALSLEKKLNGVFTSIQPLAISSQQLNYLLQDANPAPGWNEYRVKMTTASGETFYSPTEGLFYTPATYIQVHPNPAMAGSDLNIISQDDATNTIYLYDSMGRLTREYTQDGSIKIIETLGLRPGPYFIKVLSSAGIVTQTKVILL